MRKRILSLALCFALALSLLPTGALAAETSDWIEVEGIVGGNIKFDASTGTIVDCEETVTSADIPGEIQGVPVTAIGDDAFDFCISLNSVTIPDSVTNIGDWSFFKCLNLSSVSIPGSVMSIGSNAFRDCSSLSSVSIPGSVTSIGEEVFSGCKSLKSIFVDPMNSCYCSDEDGVLFNKGKTHLIQYPAGNDRTSYSIPDSVTSIGSDAFRDFISLSSVSIPDSVTSIGAGAFAFCRSLSSVSIPDSVTSIGDWVFGYCCGLSSVSIPDSVTGIGGYAFYGCSSLSSVSIPGSVTSIGDFAFYDCSSLTDVYYAGTEEEWNKISIGVDNTCLTDAIIHFESIGEGNEDTIIWIEVDGMEGGEICFDESTGEIVNCDKTVTSANIPSSIHGVAVTSIGDNAFSDCSSLTSVVIPDSVVSIGKGAFGHCNSLPGMTIPNSVTSIGASAFVGCGSLTSVTLPDGVTSIGEWSFAWCKSLPNVTIPGSVTGIGDYAFYGCWSLTGVTISDGVTRLGDYAFYGCGSLPDVTIPDSVTSIGEGVFAECSGLQSINVAEGNQYYSSEDGVLYDKCKDTLISYPNRKQDASFEIPTTVETILPGTFCNDMLKHLSVADGNQVFYTVDGVLFQKGQTEGNDILYTYLCADEVLSYRVPDGVTEIAESAFFRNRTLTEIDTNQVVKIGAQAFFDSFLIKVTLGPVEEVADMAFAACRELSSITFPETVKRLGNQVIGFCDSMEYVVFQGETPDFGEDGSLSDDGNENIKYIYVPGGSLDEYTNVLAGKCNAETVIIEGEYEGTENAQKKINGIQDTSSVEDINAAATSIVRLSKADAAGISDNDLLKVENLLLEANKETLDIVVDDSSAGAKVAVQGAALASGLVESQDADGKVSGKVEFVVAKQENLSDEDRLILDFTMRVNGQEKNLQAPVIVSVTLPDDWNGQPFLLIHQDDYGGEESIAYTLEDNVCTFRAASFSSYIFRGVSAENSVFYEVDQNVSEATLYLAEYTSDGQMVNLKTWMVSGTGNQQFAREDGMNYKAFLLDSDMKPAGTAEIPSANTQ